jgi:Tfp pilus assembly protein PilV
MKSNQGMALVEILIGSAIISMGILAISTSYTEYYKYALANQKNVEATYLLEEGLEVATLFRDKGWAGNIAGVSTTTTYYLTFSSDWATTTTAQYVDGTFLRSVNFYDVKRDGSDDIVISGGTYDPNIKKVTVTVSYWQGHSTTTKTMSAYIANL